MALEIDPEKIIGEFDTTLDFPIKYVVHTSRGDFAIYIYHERFIKGDKTERSTNSDIPFATWTPDKGLLQFAHSPFIPLRDAGLMPILEEFCENAYKAWKNE